MNLQLKRPHNALTHFAVGVCLFAVFLIYFAPLFSQLNMAQSSSPSMSKMSLPMLSMQMAGHDHAKMMAKQKNNNALHTGHHMNGHDMHGDSENLLDACGYCTLLFHLNWIDAKSFELITLTPSPYPNIVQVTISDPYHQTFTSILPRAPPAIVS